jgi:hypothetical protein
MGSFPSPDLLWCGVTFLTLKGMSSVTDRVRRSTAGSTLPALQKVDLGENAA